MTPLTIIEPDSRAARRLFSSTEESAPNILEDSHHPASATRAPELLAPAGDWDCVRAAIENGADAVYFGLAHHNARARATNFGMSDLEKVMTLLQSRGLRGYITLNTLLFPRELPEVEATLRHVAQAGVDAIIVQDLGLARLARALCPDLPIHASTQMTLTSAESIRFAEQLGAERVILARELSVMDIARIRRQTRMPLEVFIHGALCVAYSGQCLTSEALGGRSANRGQCAQACRLPYELVCDGEIRDLGDQQYLLSPRDLAGYEFIPRLVQLGVTSLKIEGRLKTPEYVANITHHYRNAIDQAVAGQPVALTVAAAQEMELSFSRGFAPGWLEGDNHKRLVEGRNPRKRGLYLGTIRAIRRGRVMLELAAPIKRGDGVVFDRGRPQEMEAGGRVYEVFQRDESLVGNVSTGLVELTFGYGAIDWSLVNVGDRLWKNDDPELNRRLRQTFSGETPRRRLPVDLRVEARVGQPLRVTASSTSGVEVEVASEGPLAVAQKHPLTIEALREQLGRLGGTPYSLGHVHANIVGQPMVPLSVLGKVRHALVSRLEAAHRIVPERLVADTPVLPALRPQRTNDSPPLENEPPRLRVLCRSPHQLADVIAWHTTTGALSNVYVDFQDIRLYPNAVKQARQAGLEIYLATPRIQKPAEGPIFRVLAKAGADGILVRNLGGLLWYAEKQIPFVADFSLNVANEVSARLLHERGAKRITASYDLNHEQLLDLANSIPAPWLEVVIHQHMPMFHMEHCVFCAVLSPGTNRTNCGRPCDHHDVKLRDRIGMEHALKADVGCRNTLFNAVPQSAAEHVVSLMNIGGRDYRVELLDESATDIATTLDLYRRLLAREITGHTVWSTLKATNRVGVTRGPLDT